MSLLGALQIGSSGLAAQQAGIQVTGNNIANSATPGYTRETVQLAPSTPTDSTGQSIGSGVEVTGIEREVSQALQSGLRNANSDNTNAQTLQTLIGQVQSTFGTLNSNDLSTQMTAFFNSFSNLANNPQDPGQRALVVQGGASLAGALQSIRGNLVGIHNSVQTQIQQTVAQVNSLVGTIAGLNQQIGEAQGSTSAANSLLDSRDAALQQLSSLVNVRTTDTGNGQINVLVGSIPLVEGAIAQTVNSTQTSNSLGLPVTQLNIASSGQALTPSSGQLAAMINARDNTVDTAISTLDQFTGGLINMVNTIHSQGQGLSGLSSTTAANAVTNPNVALNAGTTATGLAFTPTNGTFTLLVTNSNTGQTVHKQIDVNLTATGTQTTLTSLAAAITAAGVPASINSSGQLALQSPDASTTFAFANDTSGVLASLGINTFFTGSNAANIGVNQALAANPSLLATGQGNTPGSNANAVALAGGYAAANPLLNGQSLQQFYTNYIGSLATTEQQAQSDATAKSTVYNAVLGQQQSYSGVNMNEEALNLISYQQAFSGSARFISMVQQMMQTVLQMVQ